MYVGSISRELKFNLKYYGLIKLQYDDVHVVLEYLWEFNFKPKAVVFIFIVLHTLTRDLYNYVIYYRIRPIP